jgi:hypothetical protein
LRQYFAGVFDNEGQSQWFETEEHNARVLRDDSAGWALRENMVRGGDSPTDHPNMVFLTEMVRRKEGADGVEARLHDGMAAIGLEEWVKYWSSKGWGKSPGRSGVGSSLLKAAPREIHLALLRLYNACLALKVVPETWRKELISPIPKQPGADRVDLLRPIKLLEVTRKAVCGIIKDRVRAAVEGAKVLDQRQHGGRSGGFSTFSAVASVTRAFEDAIARRLDLHLLSVDIRKAYDTVNRTVGLHLAMRRVGIPEEICEWFMEVGRRNRNLVKCLWEPLGSSEEQRHEFEAKRGFAQGATESPLLWNIFYDMVLSALRAGGCGERVRLATNGLQFDGGSGRAAFMDDLMICERSTGEMDQTVALLYRILTTVGLSLAETKTYHMGLQWQEPPGKTKYELRMHGDWGPSIPGERSADRVYRGANEITRIEVDVGLRELGIWVDGLSDWGEQLQKIRESLDGVLTELARKRIPLELANYLWKAVITPKALYALTVASPPDEEICELEQWAWRKFNHQFGVHPSFPRALSRLAPEAGGWGFESWRTQVAKARARLADDLINHSAPEIRRLWASGRWTSMMRRPHGGGAQRLLGIAGRDADEDNPKAKTWLDRTASLWEIEGVAMEDGWAVGGSSRGQDGLIGNLLPAASFEAWMTLVDTFACYPGLYLLHEIATQGGVHSSRCGTSRAGTYCPL